MDDGCTTMCPAETTICDLLGGHLAEESAAQIDLHLDHCTRCRRLLAALVRQEQAPRRNEIMIPAFVPGTRIGRYEVLGRIGAGAMSTVYAAHDVELNRKVALKVLQLDDGEAGRQWLLREARAIAKLQHPNLITLYDAGEFEGRVFLSMEYVSGGTLKDWLRAAPRSPAEILRTFALAGQGLHAVHQAGVVHRDFKPENVLVTNDGYVYVTDFGLARDRAKGEGAGASEVTAESLTRSSVFAGTPAYMAPDQLAGDSADAQSDQFSFCLALYEALYGVRPLAATTVPELRAAYSRLTELEIPRKRNVPRRVRRALRRGLALVPGARFPTMGALVTQLEDSAGTGHPILLAAGGVLALLGIVVLGLVRAPAYTGSPCQSAAGKLAGIWDEHARTRVRSAFVRSPAPYAADALATVSRELDRYGRDWDAMNTEVCEATQVRHQQSAELQDARMQCLEDRRLQLQALVQHLEIGDEGTISRAPMAVGELASIAACADLQALRRPEAPPADAEVSAPMGGIRAELAELNTQFLLGRFAEAMAHASKLEPRVQALRGRSQQAEALLVMGRIASQAQLPDQAAHWYEAAARAAELGRADRASAEARIRLFGVLGSQSPATVQAESAAVAAAAALEHLGRDPQLEALLELEQGDSAMARGAVSEVLTHHRQAIAAVDHVDLVPLQRATLLGRAAFGCFEADDLSGAQAANQQALALWEHVLGPHHPFVAKTLSNLGLILRSTGDLDGARALFIRALAIRRAALPPDHPDIAHSLYNLGCVEATVGRHDAAAPLIKEALGIYGRVPANLANPQLGKMLTGLATVESAQRQHDVTRPSNLRALRVLLHAVCPTHPDVASLYDRMAEVDMDVGRSSTMRSLF